MRIGIHVRIGMGIEQAVMTAAEIGCEAIQIFAANPNAWHSREIDLDLAERFRELTEKHSLHPVVVHTPYLLNLASPDSDIYAKSISALADSMRRADVLGASYVVTHIGSHRGSGLDRGIGRVCDAVSAVLGESSGNAVLLIENSAGGGDTIGSKFGELHAILDRLGGYSDRLGVCLDTAHLWGAGYDVSGKAAVENVVMGFDSEVGLGWLKLVHLNDTRMELGSRRDRHANIGTGNIGEEGSRALLNCPALSLLTGIIETPPRPPEDERDIDILKRFRGTS